ncbi:MAG: ferrous iron transport protein B, partial [Bacteroidia bacterium]|nr:ferrous iron transport protein B [Bacteroidia bacterium]
QLQKELGVTIIPINARKEEGIEELKKEICLAQKPKNRIIGTDKFAPQLTELLSNGALPASNGNPYQKYLKCYSHDYIIDDQKDNYKSFAIEHKFYSENLQAKDTIERYTFIDGILNNVLQIDSSKVGKNLSEKLDSVLTHKVYGYLIFLGILFMIFQAIFTWSAYPMAMIEAFFGILGTTISVLPSGALNDLVVNGIIAGLGGIFIFIPQIAFLFGFLAILEDTGYMARVSLLTDKLMKSVGLNGKSIVPLISSTACAIPSIMATRTIESWKDRLITIMVTPLMSCSARLPVYTLLIALAIPDQEILGIFNLQGLVLMGFYLLGFIAVIGVAFIMKHLIKVRERSFFILELPDYKSPRWSNIGLTLLEKIKIFMIDVGKVIICISIILWGLASYGPGNSMELAEHKYDNSDLTLSEKSQLIQQEKLSNSYAGRLGKLIEPAIQPLGFDWKIGIALITSFAAREVFVGTIATLYSVGSDKSENMNSIRNKMRAEINPTTNKPLYSLATVLSLMVFYAFAMQCMSTVAVVKRETNSWKWPILQIVYMTGLAYFSSLIIYQLLS